MYIIVAVNIPEQPDWLFQRPMLTMDFVPDTGPPDQVGIIVRLSIYLCLLIKNLALYQSVRLIRRIALNNLKFQDVFAIGTLPHALQENAIIEDLLSCMEVCLFQS